MPAAVLFVCLGNICRSPTAHGVLVHKLAGRGLAALEAMRPADVSGALGLFLGYGSRGLLELPDPYYGGSQGFEAVLDLVEDAADGLLARTGGHPG